MTNPQQIITKLQLKEKEVLVATSAGSDSMVLLDGLYRNGVKVQACYINHLQRKNEIAKEVAHLEAYCKARDIPFFSLEINLEKGERVSNKQSFFREERYRLLIELAKERQLSTIATAHHQDDQMETILMRLVKNYAIPSYRGISETLYVDDTVKIIRPLLSISKETILAYCQQYQLSFLTDSSNATDDYLRNSLRHHVIPLFKQENHEFTATFVEKISDFMSFYDHIYQQLQTEMHELFHQSTTIEYAVFMRYLKTKDTSLQKQIIHILLQEYLLYRQPIRQEKINEIIATLTASRARERIPLDDNNTLCMQYNTIFIQIATQVVQKQQQLDIGETMFDDYIIHCQMLYGAEDGVNVSHSVFTKGVFLRYPEKDDYIILKNGKKKLNRLYIDEKVLPIYRFHYPILVTHENEVIYDFLTKKIGYSFLQKTSNNEQQINIYLKEIIKS